LDLDAVWGGEWGQLSDGCIRWDGDGRRGRSSFGGEFGAFHCNQWGRRRALPKLFQGGLDFVSDIETTIISSVPLPDVHGFIQSVA